MMMCNDLMCTD